jgi:CoA:oxalate CoA-transferase
MLADPQVQYREMVREVTHHTAGTLRIANTPLRMSRSESGIKGPPPDFGGDTAAVLHQLLGMNADEVAAMAANGIVSTEGGPDVEQLLK